ncbi:MAG: zinc dependent phospholipase C family protein [Candidatus Wallbacteria bacterium]|nr:zinc dependent phospholipase C family protein [Candidatus Wallbacteria bacterium]
MTRTLLWVLLLATAQPTAARGWSAVTHRAIAARAAERLGGELGRLLLDRRAALLDGAVAPDRRGRGHIPSQDHVWHALASADGTHFGNGPGRAASMLWMLANRGAPSPADAAFELGRVCHVVADLNQPLHTDGGREHPYESRYHSRYEKDVERLWDALESAATGTAPSAEPGESVGRVESNAPADTACSSPASFLEGRAIRAHAGYLAVEAAYLGGGGLVDIEELTRKQLEASVAATVALWRTLPADLGTAQRPTTAVWFRLLLVVAGYLAASRSRPGHHRRAASSLRRAAVAAGGDRVAGRCAPRCEARG